MRHPNPKDKTRVLTTLPLEITHQKDRVIQTFHLTVKLTINELKILHSTDTVCHRRGGLLKLMEGLSLMLTLSTQQKTMRKCIIMVMTLVVIKLTIEDALKK